MKKINKKYQLIIIGGGPAGITAGIYATRQKLKCLLITKNFGGQIARKAVAIENYPGFEKISGLGLIKRFIAQLKKGDIDIEMDSVTKLRREDGCFFISTKNKKNFLSSAVIIASGADPRPLEIQGEKKFIGKGVSYCVVCDAPFFRNKIVAVVGGGDAGYEAAISLCQYAQKIYILEYGIKPKARQNLQNLAKQKKKIIVITQAQIKKIIGQNFVQSIIYQDRKTHKDKKLLLNGVFVEIGSQPATSFVKDLVDFNQRDEIKINLKTNQTKTPGLFATGDVREGDYKQIVIASGDGARAALTACQYLRK